MACANAAFFEVRWTRRAKGRPDIFDRLEADRARLRLLMARLRESRDGTPDRRRLFDMLCDAVEAYGAAAEQTFYAELLARAEDQQAARRAVEVYDEAARLIGALSDMETADEAWRAGVTRLAEHLEAHFRAEENDTLALARTLIGGERADRLGDTYERTRRQWIETFARLPGEDQPLPAARLRRPLRAARPFRSATSR